MPIYRQTMTITIDVEADSRAEADDLAGDIYFDYDHAWRPQTTVVMDDHDCSDCEWHHHYDPGSKLGDYYTCSACGQLTQVG